MKSLLKFVSVFVFVCFLFSSDSWAWYDKTPMPVLSPLADEEFTDKLRHIPIRFKEEKEKTSTGYKLVGLFEPPENRAGVMQSFSFTVTRDFRGQYFLKRSGDYGEQISFDKFIDKRKDKLWLVTYLPLQNNEIFSAEQFSDWEHLNSAYPQDPDDVNQTIYSIEFWGEQRFKTLIVHSLIENTISWMVLKPFSGTLTDTLKNEMILFSVGPNGKEEVVRKYHKYNDGMVMMLSNHGDFLLHKNCMFGVVESTSAKGIVSKATIGIIGKEKVRVRLKTVDRKYFVDNMAKELWFCYYNARSGVVLRLAQASNSAGAAQVADKSNEKKDKK